MTIRKALEDCKVLESGVDIMLRCYSPDHEDLLWGYGFYDGNIMEDDEGAWYDLNYEIIDYEYDANDPIFKHGLLIIWFDCSWLED